MDGYFIHDDDRNRFRQILISNELSFRNILLQTIKKMNSYKSRNVNYKSTVNNIKYKIPNQNQYTLIE